MIVSIRLNLTRKTALAAAASVAAVAALTGCHTVGPSFRTPPAPTTTAYTQAGDALPNAQHIALGQKVADDWWRAFQSPDLDRVMRQALAGNPSLAAANATLLALHADLTAVKGQRLPEVDLSAGVERERLNFQALGLGANTFPGLSIDNNPTFPLYSVGPSVTYALDLWGGVHRQVESAAARTQAQARQVDAAYLTLTGNVATQAALIAAVRAEIATVKSVVADDERNIALVRSASRAGGVAREETVNADAQMAADSALLPPLEQQLSLARHALARLVGQAPADWTPPDFDVSTLPLPTTIPVSLPSALVRERPDILQAEAELHAATADIGVATAKLYPNITLSAALTESALTPQTVFSATGTAYTVGAGLTAPLFDGGRLRARRQAAIADADAAADTYRATVLHAFTEVADLLSALGHDEAALAAAQHQQTTAEAALNFAQTAYREGGAGLIPVVIAQRQVNNARLGVVRAEAQRYLDTIQLFVATGHGWGGSRVG
jgi:NodT family efflux transporter outer membrane factor (OMF) lipoprotein